MLKNAIRRWLGFGDMGDSAVKAGYTMALQPDTMEDKPVLSMVVHQALNGRMIQIGRFQHNPHGPDWTYRIYIVPDGQPMSEAFATCMVLYGHDFS